MRTRDMRVNPASTPSGDADDVAFHLSVTRRGGHRVVQIEGELDFATRNEVRRACLAGRRKAVIVEMAETTFMDCSGYGALVAARRELQEQGGSLTLHNQAGQPAQLLTMLALLERHS